MKKYDVIIIGAGAAGLSAAKAAIDRNKNVAIIDMGQNPARKVMISGGGRCNFTNDSVARDKYFGENTGFVQSAITKVTPADILNWVKSHNIPWVEKNPGQYFCKNGAKELVYSLLSDAKKADYFYNTKVIDIKQKDSSFNVIAENQLFMAQSVIISTGGISFPALGTSDFGYKTAKQFGHKIVQVRPALCAIKTHAFPSYLSGVSLNVEITIDRETIKDDLLFTHFGISGPAVYRATVRNIDDIKINLLPNDDIYKILRNAKTVCGRKSVATILSDKMPAKLAKWLCPEKRNVADYKDVELRNIAEKIHNYIVCRNDITLYNLQSAEVVRGGVSTENISSKTMESKLCPRLFFAGEVLDVTGDLGGFNLHWAWASGRIAGENA